MRLIFLENLLVHGSKIFGVHVARNHEHWVSGRVGREWLVKRIVANDVRVSGKSGGHMVPVADEFVLKTIFVGEKSSKACHGLLGQVVSVEVTGLAVFNQRIVILILSETKAFDIRADSKLFINSLGEVIDKTVDAVVIFCKKLFGIEVGDTFSAHSASENVLMGVDKSVDASLSKFVDHLFDFVQVCIIILAFCALDSFPHDSETDEVHAPLLQADNILVIKRILAVKLTS